MPATPLTSEEMALGPWAEASVSETLAGRMCGGVCVTKAEGALGGAKWAH